MLLTHFTAGATAWMGAAAPYRLEGEPAGPGNPAGRRGRCECHRQGETPRVSGGSPHDTNTADCRLHHASITFSSVCTPPCMNLILQTNGVCTMPGQHPHCVCGAGAPKHHSGPFRWHRPAWGKPALFMFKPCHQSSMPSIKLDPLFSGGPQDPLPLASSSTCRWCCRVAGPKVHSFMYEWCCT
jgi:hypothetical protein